MLGGTRAYSGLFYSRLLCTVSLRVITRAVKKDTGGIINNFMSLMNDNFFLCCLEAFVSCDFHGSFYQFNFDFTVNKPGCHSILSGHSRQSEPAKEMQFLS